MIDYEDDSYDTYSRLVDRYRLKSRMYRAYDRIAESFAQSASQLAASENHTDKNAEFLSAEKYFVNAQEALDALLYAACSGKDDDGKPKFGDELWQHDNFILDGDPYDNFRKFDRGELDYAARKYLSQPLRSDLFELRLMDALAGCEITTFRYDVHCADQLNKTLEVPTVAGIFFRGLLIVALIAAILSAGVSYLFFDGTNTIQTGVIISIPLFVFLLWIVSSEYKAQKMKSDAYATALQLLLEGYNRVPHSTPYSPTEVRRVFIETSKSGVVWPNSIFAILDSSGAK